MTGETILVVDDEVNIRELARMYLEQEGFQIVTAVNGQQALEQVRQDPPSLVVLDLMLPEIDGWEVCRLITQFLPKLGHKTSEQTENDSDSFPSKN